MSEKSNGGNNKNAIATALGGLVGTAISIAFIVMNKPKLDETGKKIEPFFIEEHLQLVLAALPAVSVIISGYCLYLLNNRAEKEALRKAKLKMSNAKAELKEMLGDPITSPEQKEELIKIFEIKQREYLKSQ